MNWKITLGFSGEIVFFSLVGAFLVTKNYSYSVIAMISAMVIAGYVGKLIEKEAIEKHILK